MKTSEATVMTVMNQLQCHPFTPWVTFACIEYFAMDFSHRSNTVYDKSGSLVKVLVPDL